MKSIEILSIVGNHVWDPAFKVVIAPNSSWINCVSLSSGRISVASVVLLQLPGAVWDWVYWDGSGGSFAEETDELHAARPGE